MIIQLNPKTKRTQFDCGNTSLNQYFYHQVSQDIRRQVGVCFVLTEFEGTDIQGYYTLSNYSIPRDDFPVAIQKKLPPYLGIPTTLLGRLAVDKSSQGKGIGAILLVDALKRSFEASKQLGSFAVVVDPIDEAAEAFYKKYGFISLPDSGKMFIPMKYLEQYTQRF